MRNPDVANVALLAEGHRAHLDFVTHQRDVELFLRRAAQNGQLDRGIDLAAHFLDRLVQGQPLHLLAVNAADDVIGQNAGTRGGGVVNRGDDLDEALFLRHFNAKATKLAGGLRLHVGIALGVHVAGMRIQRRQHSIDSCFDELLLIGLFNIVGADFLENVTEQVQVAVGVGRCGLGHARNEPGLRANGDDRCAEHGTKNDEGNIAHYPRAFSVADFTHHGPGSIAVPSLRNSI